MGFPGRFRLVLSALICLGALGPPRSDAVTFTLRRAAILTSQPSYETRFRLEIDPLSVLVEGPAMEQKGEFCQYRLLDREHQPLAPEIAWTPCHSIDKLVPVP